MEIWNFKLWPSLKCVARLHSNSFWNKLISMPGLATFTLMKNLFNYNGYVMSLIDIYNDTVLMSCALVIFRHRLMGFFSVCHVSSLEKNTNVQAIWIKLHNRNI